MADFFFFAELSKLTNQTNANKYGPVDGNETSQYRVSSKFSTGQDVMAYAVMSGQVLVQYVQTYHDPTGVNPDTFSSTLVNVILKPTADQNSGFPKVKYIIYRGLKASDFLTGTSVKSLTGSDSDFLESIWSDFNDYKADHPADATIQAWARPHKKRMGFGLESGLNSSDSVTELFNADILDGTQQIVLHTVNPGETLGHFNSGSVCVDFILEDRNSIIDLYSARKTESIIEDTTSLTGLAPGDLSPNQMIKREKVLGYIDPVVFYFCHYHLEIGLNEESGGSTSTTPVNNDLDALYSHLAPKFKTSNTVYIDIRNEFGYSINYQKDYQGASGQPHYRKHIELSINGATATQENYYIDHWPIFTKDLTSVSLGSLSSYEVEIGVHNLFNKNVLSYADYTHSLLGLPNTSGKFQWEFTTGTTWSESRLSYVRPVDDGGVDKSPAWLIKYMICRTGMPDVPSLPPGVSLPSGLFWRDNKMDTVFGPLFFEEKIKASNKKVSFSGLGKRYVGEGGIDRIVELGVTLSDNFAIFRASTVDTSYVPLTIPPFQPYNIDDDADGIVNDTSSFGYLEIPQSLLIQDVDALAVDQQLIVPNLHFIQDMNIIRPEYKLIIKQTELASLRSDANTHLDPDLHDVYINLDSREELEDDNDKKYIKYNLRLSGHDDSGNFQTVAPTTVLFLLSSSDLVFNTNIPIALSKAEPFDNANANFSVSQLIEDITTLEEYFYTYDEVGGDSVKNMATRIRVHSYGFPGDMMNTPALNQAVPKATYMDVQPGTMRERLKTLEPIPTEFEEGHRYYLAYNRLTSNASENGLKDNLSPYINCPTSAGASPTVNVDMGQIFYGFESLVIPFIRDVNNTTDTQPTDVGMGPNIDLKKYLTIYSSPSTNLSQFKIRRENAALKSGVGPSNGTGFVNIFEIDEAFDLTAFVANIATPSAELLSNELYAKFSGSIVSAYEHSAPDVDLYGNADALGIRSAYIVLKGNNPTLKLSDVFKLYYNGTTSLITNTSNLETLTDCEYYTVSYRWLIVAAYFGFVKKISSTSYTWLPDSSDPTEQAQWNTTRDYWLRKMYIFSEMWYNKVLAGDSLFKKLPVAGMIAAYHGEKKTLVDDGHDATVTTYNTQVFDTIFLPFIKNKLITETSGITVS